MQMISEPKCSQCSLPFIQEQPGLVCGACLDNPPAYDEAIAPVLYADKGRDLVLALKHGRLFAAAPAMARMMSAPLARKIGSGDCPVLVPVPLHHSRLISRRFNQSQLLAESLAEQMDLPVDTRLLVRTRATPSQGGLKRRGRLKNVRGAFEISDKAKADLTGSTVILVDDVLTTGATAGACAEVLKKAGAHKVLVASFARVGDPIAG